MYIDNIRTIVIILYFWIKQSSKKDNNIFKGEKCHPTIIIKSDIEHTTLIELYNLLYFLSKTSDKISTNNSRKNEIYLIRQIIVHPIRIGSDIFVRKLGRKFFF